MESPHLLFNIHSEQEWNEELVPSLKMIVSFDDSPMTIMGNGTEYKVIGLDLEDRFIKYILPNDKKVYNEEFSDFYLLDEDKKILTEKTIFLVDLYNHIFKN